MNVEHWNRTSPKFEAFPIKVLCEDRVVAQQLDPETAFKITTLRKDPAAFESHLRRFLDHTSLERVYWANIALGEVSFREVIRSRGQKR